jgi:hypothetical protein
MARFLASTKRLATLEVIRRGINNGKVSTVWPRHPIWQQSPVVEKSDPSQLECKYPKGNGPREWQAGRQASLHFVHPHADQGLGLPNNHQSFSLAAVVRSTEPLMHQSFSLAVVVRSTEPLMHQRPVVSDHRPLFFSTARRNCPHPALISIPRRSRTVAGTPWSRKIWTKCSVSAAPVGW